MEKRFKEKFAGRPFDPAAYEFVLQSLDRTIHACDPPRHVSGHEVLQGLHRDAHEHFGPMAAHVLLQWGIRGGPDVGTIVFDLVERGILARTDDDRPEDFASAEDFLGEIESTWYRDHAGFADSTD